MNKKLKDLVDTKKLQKIIKWTSPSNFPFDEEQEVRSFLTNEKNSFNSFEWCSTKEGQSYWSNIMHILHDSLQECCSNIDRIYLEIKKKKFITLLTNILREE